MQLFYREYGAGFPVLILHGLFGSHDNWHSVSQKLANRFRVFALDLRNHSHSPHSPQMDYSQMADDLEEFMREHSLDRAALIGHSMGGKVAMQFAFSHPNRVAKLVVVDIAPRTHEPAHDAIFEGLLSLDLARFRTRREIEEALAPWVPELPVRRFLLKNLRHDSDGDFHWKPNLPALRENYAVLNEPPNAPQVTHVPACFVRGGKSDYVRDEDIPEIMRWFPRAEIRTIPDAGHWVHADAPKVFLEIVEAFL